CRAAGDDELGCSGGLAPCFELPVWSGCRFEHQHRRAAPGFLIDHPTRAFAPGLFVRSPKKDNTPARQPARMCKRINREYSVDDSALHIENAGTERPSPPHPKGHLLDRAETVDR